MNEGSGISTEDAEPLLHVEVEFTRPVLCLHYLAAAAATREFTASMSNRVGARVRIDNDIRGGWGPLPGTSLWST